MPDKPKIYDSEKSLTLSLDRLISIYQNHNVDRVIFKMLSPNDNSKNQPYLAGHFTDIGFIPTKELIASPSTSKKTSDPKRQIKFTADLDYRWLSADGIPFTAPTAKLIYYPQFPEVRLSGFLKGCAIDMGGWMDTAKKGRAEGRVLFLGLRRDGAIFAYLATPASRLAKEVYDSRSIFLSGVLRELPYTRANRSVAIVKHAVHEPIAYSRTADMFAQPDTTGVEYAIREGMADYKAEDMATQLETTGDRSRYLLLSELKRIHNAGPIPGKKLSSEGVAESYRARNGGGYTLEAELGVVPNGIAEPDFQGWEIKQFGVERFHLIDSKVLTIMTPEPDGGFYKSEGVKPFMHQYGYENANIADRRDFTGRHFYGKSCDKTGLTLVMPGFDASAGKMADATGCVGLLDGNDNMAASWSFAKLLGHWKKKHAKAAYIPSVANDTADGMRSYHFGKMVRLYEGTTIDRLLSGIVQHNVYYDPGIKMEHVSTKALVKKRSQFRVKSKDLNSLYDHLDIVDVIAPFK
jgi:hypothetical protein